MKGVRLLLCRGSFLAVLLGLAGCGRSAVPERAPEEPVHPAAAPAEPGAPATPALRPIVDAGEAQLFGAVAGGRWLPADSAAPMIREGTTYQLYTLTRRLGEQQSGAAGPPAETCTNPTVEITGVQQAQEDIIAVGGEWNALPRVPSRQSTEQHEYHQVLAQWLQARGIADPTVNLTQLLRVDLEGDGAEEVLIAANLLRGAGTSALAGDYSVVLLRRVVGGEVQTLPLAHEYYPDGCIAVCAPAARRIAAVLDLSGDGVMEVVLAWQDYEGRGKTIYRVEDTRVEEVLSWVCAP
jgi:hypothetical protein